jgi:hypothetical protein
VEAFTLAPAPGANNPLRATKVGAGADPVRRSRSRFRFAWDRAGASQHQPGGNERGVARVVEARLFPSLTHVNDKAGFPA